MNEEQKAKILKDIRSSGFPLELETADRLEQNGYRVLSNLRYNDSVGDSEIDIIATLVNNSGSRPCALHLVIECKVSRANPWVFFRQRGTLRPVDALKAVILETPLHIDPRDRLVPGSEKSPLRQLHYTDVLPIARTHFEAHKKDAGSDIYRATASARRAAESLASYLGNPPMSQQPERGYDLILPVVLCDTDLVLATRQEDDFVLTQEDHVIFRASRFPTGAWMPAGHVDEVLVDVVRRSALGAYTDRALRDLDCLVAHTVELEQAGVVRGAFA